MTDAQPFTPEVFEFLRQLKRRNNREWFARNKSRYEQALRNPALLFIAAVTPQLARLAQVPVHQMRGSLFRIYRDIRFSADKRPFKTHVGIQFSLAKDKDVHAPCYYLHLEPESCFVAAGVWHPDAAALLQIRNAIIANPGQWKKLRKKVELGGDRLSRPPRGFDPAHPFIEDLKCKDFITSTDLEESQVCGAKFIPELLRACRAMTPLVEFTRAALAAKTRSAEVA